MTKSAAAEKSMKVADLQETAIAWFIVVKPGITVMVLISTLAGMYMAHKGLPDSGLIFWTLFTTGLATAGAASLNNYWDRDIDFIMKRTRVRPLPAGKLSASKVLTTGLLLSILSVVISLITVNFTVAALLAASIFIYVVLYTILSKRQTPMGTFIGGVGGAFPPVIGYAAVRPELDVYALSLFLIIFTWQHPHFWSLALKYIDEYKMAGVKNHPTVLGVPATKKRIAIWAVIMAIVTTSPYFLGMAGCFLSCGGSCYRDCAYCDVVRFFVVRQKTCHEDILFFVDSAPASLLRYAD